MTVGGHTRTKQPNWAQPSRAKPMNKWNYPELYMHSQLQPEWADVELGHSGKTIGSDGCFISCITYLWSRKENRNHEIPDAVRWMDNVNGFTEDGLLLWDRIYWITGLVISSKKSLFTKYTMRQVLVPDKNRRLFTHWVVELRGGLMYDPLRTGGNFVHDINFFQPVRDSKNNIVKRYLK